MPNSETERQRPPTTGAERPMLQGWLDFHRQTLLDKCAGLSDEQLATASASPSPLTLLRLVRHLGGVEREWLRNGIAGNRLDDVYRTPEHPGQDFNDLAGASCERDLAIFREECRQADESVAAKSLDDAFTTKHGFPVSLRWVYLHLIEEYARHNGHADLIRERIDGVTGV